MTINSYYSFMNEKIGENEKNKIDPLTELKLVLAYNGRFIDGEKAKFFEKNLKEDIFPLLNEASKLSYTDSKFNELYATILAFCDDKIIEAFCHDKLYGSDGLFNVHNIVLQNEMGSVTKKEKFKEANEIAEFSYKNVDIKREYLERKESVTFNKQMASNPAAMQKIFDNVLARNPVASFEKFKENFQGVVDNDNFALYEIEQRYFPRIIEEVVKEDLRLSNPANEITY